MEYILFLPQSFGRIICVLCYVLALFYVVPIARKNKTFTNIIYYMVAGLTFHLAYLFDFSVNHPIGVYGIMVAGLIPVGLTFILRFAYDFTGLRWPKEKRIVTIIISIAIAIAVVDYLYNASQADIKINATGYVTKYTSQLLPGLTFMISFASLTVFIRQARAARKNQATEDYKGPLSFASLVLVELATAVILFIFFYTNRKTDFDIHAILNLFFFFVIGGYTIIFLKYSKHYVSLPFKLLGLTLAVSFLCFNMLGYFMISNAIASFDDKVETSFKSYMQYKRPLHGQKPLYIFDKAEQKFLENPVTNEGFQVEMKKYLGFGIQRHKESYLFSGSERNYIQYQFFYQNKWLLVGFDELPYRTMTHHATMQVLYLFAGYLLILAVLLPFLVRQGILDPVKNLMHSIKPLVQKKHKASLIQNQVELALLNDSVRILQESMVEYEQLEERYHQLEQIIKKQKEKKQRPYTSEGLIDKVEQVRLFIDENYTFDLSREGLAASANISPSTLGKIFKQQTEKSIRDYQNELRVEKSCELLKTDLAIITIAYQVGFDSLRTFNRNFRSQMGCSPSVYREKILSGA